MSIHRLLSAALLAAVLGLDASAQTQAQTPAAEKPSCAERLQALAPVAMRLPYREFDQTPQGWRQLMDCPAEAVQLLERYLLKQEHELRGVRWHHAQALAFAGETERAIESALLALTPVALEARSSFSWNPYALATVAFLKKDRAAFDLQHAAQRQAAQRHAANRTNLDVLDRLGRCFDLPYAKAYVCAAPEAAN